MKKKYKPVKGARFTEAQAQSLGSLLERIGFQATPRQIVDASRDPASETHELFFKLDDASLADQQRLALARYYVNHLQVIVLTDGGESRTKAFHSVVVTHGDTAERGYCSVETIVEDEGLTQQVIRKALAELTYWRDRYKEYQRYPELADVFSAINKASVRSKAKRTKPRRRHAMATAR